MVVICLQTSIVFSPSTDDSFCFLNESDNSISFVECLNFIYEVQLSKVPTVEKWATPIKIRYEGNPTKKDVDILNQIVRDFNKINGFPGMRIVDKDENVLLIYAPGEILPEIQNKYDMDKIDKGICRRFSDQGEIKQAIIVIESDIDQDYKNSVVLHEIFHMVGFYGHSYDNTSIINRIEEPVSKLSVLDTLSFRMLYNPEILIGMEYHEIDAYYRDRELDEFLK
ncbi:DUF2927 domain-containing protein [Methanimicrococcus hacksteinii]|nr:DUF2927 domain-containing protein [Methanimicrococcus sp. At1]